MTLPDYPFDPQSVPVAITEIILMLCIASVAGWLLARIIIRRRVRILHDLIEEKKIELADFRTFMKNPTDQPVATNASKTAYPVTSPDHAPDDLKILEGVGPKIEEILNKEGIHTFEQLAETSVIRIVGILKKAGPRYQLNDPSSWPNQAVLAKEQKWEELGSLKTQLITGEKR
ncbi:hypothetical protein [Dyadobacter sp. CY323]|uniref:hypothetical protein n=1 Tax=Dyadobacter sp. CY323 TaxID=2907302 RepID=UPI001F478A89|nr:hypothetical protein [Dyadobacter sp. CY323]MCE6989896.1 hypothetical protein [Dyadobacter sp. CY323]